MSITEKQVSAIAYHMMQNDIKGDVNSFSKLRKLDKGTASDVISDFMAGRKEEAIQQLTHLDVL